MAMWVVNIPREGYKIRYINCTTENNNKIVLEIRKHGLTFKLSGLDFRKLFLTKHILQLHMIFN